MGCIPAKSKTSKSLTDNKKALSQLSTNTRTILSELKDLPEHFRFKKVLGQGRFGRIMLWESVETGMKFAIKAISKRGSSYLRLRDEVRILSTVDHPNIVKYFKSFQSEKYVYVVMEYCPGGNLFEKVVKQEKFHESEARVLMEEILRAINHCHHLGIIHRDLKPENIMYSAEGILKIIDFGLSMNVAEYSMEKMAGTLYYMAPEVFSSGIFSKACDVWSLGIILHILLSGYIPIVGKDVEEVRRIVMGYGGPKFEEDIWRMVSEEAKSLVKAMLNPDYERRITVADALKHPWFTSGKADGAEFNPEVLKSLTKYGEFSDFKKKILNLLVKSINEKDLKEIQQMFLDLDTEKTGLITYQTLHESLLKNGYEMTAEELERIAKKVNHKGEAFINYSEFIAAIIGTQQFLTEEKLWDLFRMLDIRRQGSLNRNILHSAFKNDEELYKLDSIRNLVKKQKKSDDQVTFEEFKCMLLN